MFNMQRLTALLLLVAGCSLSLDSYAQVLDCGPLVSLQNGVIVVEPAPDDDTEEIQCALDSAGELGVTTVKLTSGLYAISQVRAEGFVGTFEGQSKAATSLFIFDDSIDCDAELEAGRVPAAFKFVNGNVKFAKMTLDVNQPCIAGEAPELVLIHFTGSDANSGCESETGFGQVDRMDIFSASGLEGVSNTAIAAYAEGTYFGTCRDTQLGTFKLNRSLVSGFGKGANLSLRGAGQVDINFSEFIDNEDPVLVDNANQLLTVQSNTFLATADNPYTANFGVRVRNFGGPTENRVVIYNNDFGWQGEDMFGVGVLLLAIPGITVSAAITANTFDITGSLGSEVIIVSAINGASISGNLFRGPTFSGIDVVDASTNNVISGNDFSQLSPSIGDTVFFAPGSTDNIVGPGQAAIVFDEDGGNFVLNPQAPQAVVSSQANTAQTAADAFAGLVERNADARARLAILAAEKGVARLK